jgi:RNA polymerase sigma-70 factor (ECF subfamily)
MGPGQKTPAPTPDWSAAIVAIATKADKARFEELFLHFAPRLKAFYLRVSVAPGAAEDMAQDVMLAVWRKAAYFDPERASAATWIFTIARNLRIDQHRRRHDTEPLGENFDPAAEPDAIETMISVERERRVRAALAKLPSEQSDVVRLSFFEDRPHSEIAEALRLPLGTVKSRIRLAMARLRALVGEDP